MSDATDIARQAIAERIGRAVKARREAKGLTQRELADRLAECLPTWSHNTVAATEVGRREPSLIEALVLVTLLDCTLADLLAIEDHDIHIGPMPLRAAVEQARGVADASSVWDDGPEGPTGWALARRAELGMEYDEESFADNHDVLAELPAKPSGPGDPDHFAARRFAVELAEIEAIAERRYGHSLYAERWKRECKAILLRASLPPEAAGLMPKRSSKGERIGISRTLMAEIEPDIEELRAKKKGARK